MSRLKNMGLALVGAAGLLAHPATAQEEFSYKDLAPTSRSGSEPLIPSAARRTRAPAISSGGVLEISEAKPRTRDMIPLAMASGSPAARIYHRNKRRVSLISGIFDRLKEAAREEQLAEQRAEAARERMREERRRREVEEARRRELEAQERAREIARREEQARRRIEQASAVPSRPTPTRRQPAGGDYVVQPGDSLIKIARKVYGTPKVWTKIAEANGLGRDAVIRAGDSLVLPNYQGQSGASHLKQAPVRAAQAEPVKDYTNYDYKLYNIQPGDTLSGIAARYYGDAQGYELIRSYNAKVVARGLIAGEKLVIPVPKPQAHEDRYEKARAGQFDWNNQGQQL